MAFCCVLLDTSAGSTWAHSCMDMISRHLQFSYNCTNGQLLIAQRTWNVLSIRLSFWPSTIGKRRSADCVYTAPVVDRRICSLVESTFQARCSQQLTFTAICTVVRRNSNLALNMNMKMC